MVIGGLSGRNFRCWCSRLKIVSKKAREKKKSLQTVEKKSGQANGLQARFGGSLVIEGATGVALSKKKSQQDSRKIGLSGRKSKTG